MTGVRVGIVDVYVIRVLRTSWRVLVLRRAAGTRSTGSWETVHGRIEPGETPKQAAVREVEEEAGVRASVAGRLDDVVLAMGDEHQRIRYFLMAAVEETEAHEGRGVAWLSASEAMERLLFPQAKATLQNAIKALKELYPGLYQDRYNTPP